MKDIIFTVQSKKFLSESVFELKLHTRFTLPPMRAGQFAHIEVPDASLCLRRPFCLYQFDRHSITLVIAVVGKGTKSLSNLKRSDTVRGIVPLGNGFTLSVRHQKIALIGGGIGCAPLLRVPYDYPGREFRSYLGFSTKSGVMFCEEFEQALSVGFLNDAGGGCDGLKKSSRITVSTDDGSFGFKGYAADAFLADYKKGYRPDVILTCGPEPMIKAVQKISAELKIPGFMSGEMRMGCGIGACLVCACAVREDGQVKNKRACVDGPVFRLEDLIF
ncbi:MAG: dihydroorotate dehydrogenase electron transfer subunit [Firmicutes bacterium]|nr:dihydroorotate dehydrogenase electron transfer subunit [Bacillota bacterium]